MEKLLDGYRKACNRQWNKTNSGVPVSKILNYKFKNEHDVVRDIVNNRVKTTNLAMTGWVLCLKSRIKA